MEENRVSQQINDIVNDNVKRLAAIFPAVVKDGQIDFDALREELGQFSEVSAEKFELTWAGKKNAKKKALDDIVGRTLKYKPDESVNSETTENLYLEGNNLEILKLLRQNYYSAIKMIYIDPPYNTGSDFLYNDDFSIDKTESDIAEGAKSLTGEKYIQNLKSQNRFHAKWLSNMYSRLKIARDLLTEDGVIFISIDDNELENLIALCKEIFGESNYESCISWRRRTNQPNDKAKMIAKVAENIVVFSKNSEYLSMTKAFHGVPLTEERKKEYKNPDNDVNGPWSTNPWKAAVGRGGSEYSITTPTGKVYTETWYGTIDTFRELENEGRVYWTDNGEGYPRIKIYLKDAEKDGQAAINFMTPERYGSNQEGSAELEKLFETKGMFDNPKPTRLIEALLGLATDDDSIVLDFFSGTATTADAVMHLNFKDGGHRRFIMVQWPEDCPENSIAYKAGYKNICEIGKERIRRAGRKLLEEDPSNNVDIGFKVFNVDDTNIKWSSLITYDQLDLTQIEVTPDQMDFMPGSKDIDVVYEIMLRQRDVLLSESVEKLTDIGNRTYLYADAYLICLESEITKDMVDRMAAIDPVPVKYVFRDSAFKDDIALKDETFRRLKAVIEKNTNQAKQTYTVEFI